MAAALFTLLLLAILILPCSLAGGKHGPRRPDPDRSREERDRDYPITTLGIETWPVIGTSLKNMWDLTSIDLPELARRFAPQIKAALPGLLSASAGAGVTLLQLLLSILFAGVLLANAQPAYEFTLQLANRFFGGRGPEFHQLIGSSLATGDAY